MNNRSVKPISASLAPLGLMLVLLAGCKVGPNYVRPQVMAPAVYRGADNKPVSSANQNSLGDEDWAKVFNQPELQDLIRTALTNNYDVRIAAQHVLEAQAQLRITRSQSFPPCRLAVAEWARTWEVESAMESRAARLLREASMCRLPGLLIFGASIAARLKRNGRNCFRRCGPSAPSA